MAAFSFVLFSTQTVVSKIIVSRIYAICIICFNIFALTGKVGMEKHPITMRLLSLIGSIGELCFDPVVKINGVFPKLCNLI